jgi:hypothetical protein
MTQPETNYVGIFFESLFLSVCVYCMGRQFVALYYAMIELKKARRNTENSYMNLITSMKESDSMV